MKMTAAVLHAPGDLRIEEVEKPTLDPNSQDVIVKVLAAGVCGSDLDRVMKTGTYHFPTIPGHEFAGEVASVGSWVEGYNVGDRVIVAPILPCYHCEQCAMGNYGQCDHYNYLGSRTDGGFAQYVKAPAKNLIPLPDSISYLEAASIEPAAVTLHGIMRLSIKPADQVIVLGCGAIGLFAVQLAKIMGAGTIIAVDLDDEKLELAKKAGASIRFNGRQQDVVNQILTATDNNGGEIVIETAGVNITQVQSIELCKKHGQILYLGTAHKDVVIPPHVFEHIVRNEIHITGSWNSYSAPFPGKEWRGVLKYLEDGRLDIKSFITHTFPYTKAPEIIEKMFKREFMFNKVVLVMDEDT